jgi:hypothetical protein
MTYDNSKLTLRNTFYNQVVTTFEPSATQKEFVESCHFESSQQSLSTFHILIILNHFSSLIKDNDISIIADLFHDIEMTKSDNLAALIDRPDCFKITSLQELVI